MNVFVVGFAVNTEYSRVALIRKNRPEWQAGKLNGIGGHVEDGENPLDAMRREFEEETGVVVDDWNLMVTMQFPEGVIYFYRAQVPRRVFDLLTSATDEEVVTRYWPLSAYGHTDQFIPNLAWLVPLALYTADNYQPIYVTATVAEAITKGAPS